MLLLNHQCCFIMQTLQERSGRKEAELRLQEELRDSVAAAAEQVQLMQKELQNVHATVEDLKAENDGLRQQLAESKQGRDQEGQAAQQRAAEAAEAQAAMQQQLQAAAERRDVLQQQLDEALAHGSGLQQQLDASTSEGASLRQQLQEATAGAGKLQQQLQEAISSNASLQQQLDAACEARDEAQEALEVSKNVNAGLDDQIRQLMERIEQVRLRRLHEFARTLLSG